MKVDHVDQICDTAFEGDGCSLGQNRNDIRMKRANTLRIHFSIVLGGIAGIQSASRAESEKRNTEESRSGTDIPPVLWLTSHSIASKYIREK
jgi:hypothetical protein